MVVTQIEKEAIQLEFPSVVLLLLHFCLTDGAVPELRIYSTC